MCFFIFVNAQPKPSKKVLFVGNSYTYFWNLPQTVHAMTTNDSIILETRQSTAGGVSLGQHWNGINNIATREIIKNNQFDIIVLQDHSLQAINKPDSLRIFAKLFDEVIKNSGAKTYLYMTWARENNPQSQDQITLEYTKLAKEMNAILVPVGLAWQKARNLQPDIDLFDADGSHPSALGSYLSACVFYGVFSGKSPVGLPSRILSKDMNGEKLYLNIQSDKTAKFLQEVAYDVLRNN
ncbi:MAG: DUF4886 domain-containing protein [Saprospiraceae bacterium]